MKIELIGFDSRMFLKTGIGKPGSDDKFCWISDTKFLKITIPFLRNEIIRHCEECNDEAISFKHFWS